MLEILVFCIIIIVGGLILLSRVVTLTDTIIGIIYVCLWVIFANGMDSHLSQYFLPVDPQFGECYIPFAHTHILTLIVYFIAFNISVILVGAMKNILPPLILLLSLIFIAIGILISIAILLQISLHDTASLQLSESLSHQFPFFLAPTFSIMVGSRLIFQVIKQEISETSSRSYSNKYLNNLNTFLAKSSRNPIWIVILMLPVFFIVTLILILLGQEMNSIVKVFTDTTTWRFSQQMHPPIHDHTGHYLCTVAATGNPKIVKPLRFGRRNGKQIIVNRQLLIANAFEEMVEDVSPKIHSSIRKFYDKYGYNISKKINTVHLSNLTYLLMKPLEWFFLICLYLFCTKPEQKINRQYAE